MMQGYHAASNENKHDDAVMYSGKENNEHYKEELSLCKINDKKDQ